MSLLPVPTSKTSKSVGLSHLPASNNLGLPFPTQPGSGLTFYRAVSLIIINFKPQLPILG